MKRKRIVHSHRFLSITIGFLFIIAVVFGAYLFGRSTNSQSVATQKEKHDLVIKTQVETAVSMLDALYQKSQKGEFSIDEAKQRGADLLRELRYGENKDGYFWADTTDGGNVVLYGKPDVEGTNRWNSYVGGVYHVREIIKNGMKEGGGYTDYYFPKKDESIPLPKRGYSLLFEPFGWVVGTGYYLEDIQR
jgi:methyl-accepting chemotaxis protein